MHFVTVEMNWVLTALALVLDGSNCTLGPPVHADGHCGGVLILEALRRHPRARLGIRFESGVHGPELFIGEVRKLIGPELELMVPSVE